MFPKVRWFDNKMVDLAEKKFKNSFAFGIILGGYVINDREILLHPQLYGYSIDYLSVLIHETCHWLIYLLPSWNLSSRLSKIFDKYFS